MALAHASRNALLVAFLLDSLAWDTYVLLDDGFCDCTMGTRPHGHQHMVEDLPAVASVGPRHRLLGLRWRFCRHGAVLSAPRVTFRASAGHALR